MFARSEDLTSLGARENLWDLKAGVQGVVTIRSLDTARHAQHARAASRSA